MNYKQLRKLSGQFFRLRPFAVVHDGDFANLESFKIQWLLAEVSDDPREVVLVSRGADYTLTLGADHLLSFQTPDFLMLRSQVILTPDGVSVEPLPRPVGRTAAFQVDLPAVDECMDDWIPVHGSGAPEGMEILVVHRLVHGKRLYLQPGQVEPTEDGYWIHPGVHLSSCKERYIYALSVPSHDTPQARALFETPLHSMKELKEALESELIEYRLSAPKHLDRAFFDGVDVYRYMS